MADESRVNAGKTRIGRPFEPGNPGGGRPKIPEEIKAAFKSILPDAIELIKNTMLDEDEKTELRIRCAEIVIERNLGKVPQPLDIRTPLPLRIIEEHVRSTN